MPKIRAHITKILEDGTEIELVRVTDYPWHVHPILKEFLRRIYQPAPHEQLPGQQTIGLERAA